MMSFLVLVQLLMRFCVCRIEFEGLTPGRRNGMDVVMWSVIDGNG